ncbi:MAG: sodium:proton antiporter [Nitrospirae bacterium]|nr:sodium:proton antiporter [Nitrospirota bacterium]
MTPAFASEAAGHAIRPDIPLAMSTPFALLLLAIAFVPLFKKHWWEKHYPHVSLVLGVVSVAYYLGYLRYYERPWHTLVEYFSFICLIGSLFVVSSGILIDIERKSTPLANTLLLLFGAVVSNLLGTTGASMLLIRSYLRLNKTRIKGYHVIFFIFVVSNCGGALTPIGDPPLFLGYLKGIPFFWVFKNVWPIWAFTNGLILALFFAIDTYHYRKVNSTLPEVPHKLTFKGIQNVGFLAVILGSVFLDTPVREIIMIAVSVLAYKFSNKEALKFNEFNFEPIREVAILFAGIFATMMPALDWLEQNASTLGVSSPGHFFFATGILSSFLDNAPTYLNFLSAAMGLKAPGAPEHEAVHYLLVNHADYIRAISMGAVFFGANTYIGNAPNFMVKTISEQSGVPTASFIGYMFKYSIPLLIPIFVLDWWIFFRTV